MRDPLAFLDGGGFMSEVMKQHDWSRSPLGPPAAWPDTLKTAVSTCLSSRFPMVIWWGPQLCMLYNDAWQPILGDTKHPADLGRPAHEAWPETWPIVSRQFEDALGGVACWSEDLLLASDREGFMQESYFTYSHSPLRDAEGRVVGVHSVVIETTDQVLSERRLSKLRELSAAMVAAAERRDALETVCAEFVRILCADNPDAPFAVLSIVDAESRLRFCTADGIDRDVIPSRGDRWRIEQARESRSMQTAAVGDDVSIRGRPWPEPVQTVVSLPLMPEHESSRVNGVLTVGVNSRFTLNQAYLDFLRIVAAQLAGAILATRTMENEAQATRARETLMRELQHRTRNLLALVQSISDRTIDASASLADFQAGFASRLGALARIQNLLSREEDAPIEIEEILRLALAPTDATGERIVMRGPRVALPRVAVQLTSLTFHELTTNAIKYGALKERDGRLTISWERRHNGDGDAILFLRWTERCERTMAPAAAKIGFGRTLLEQAIPWQLGGSAVFSLRSDGLECVIEIPLQSPPA